MAFPYSCRNIRLDGTVLKADCTVASADAWKESSLDLNAHIGNEEGDFSLLGNSFASSAKDISYRDFCLYARLLKPDGTYITRVLSLTLLICNLDGALEFLTLGGITDWPWSSFSLEDTGGETVYLTPDGKIDVLPAELEVSSVVACKSRFSLVDGAANYLVKLIPRPKYPHMVERTTVEGIDKHENSRAVLHRSGDARHNQQRTGLFDRDGWFARNLEHVPVVGYAVAYLHHRAGNKDWAIRALAYCSKSSILCVGITLGNLLGPLGAAVGAFGATALGQVVERAIAQNISDPDMLSEFEEVTVGRMLFESIRNMVTAGAGAVVGRYLARIAPDVLGSACQKVSLKLAAAATQAIHSLQGVVPPAIGGNLALVTPQMWEMLLRDVVEGSVITGATYAFKKIGTKATKLLIKLSAALIKDQLPSEWRV